ncbi:MAG: HAMP domain-containing sensor histidine kinase [Streptococcus orisratti]|uniref:sensor histidine kinase n=1 Tax=Streptococcus orisratti TaxID=114652 RepID=UPI002A91FA0C|nr:HAMP domain-containing sensor histidine kinase [Streptococcus orisratti]MDY5635488.1 HAMP domain-containing sensor histidine kinase [Streptococcus orisratti]
MLNRLRKRLASETFTHFFHFFAVFTSIFVIMTTIILQIMRYGVYSSVDTRLQEAVNSYESYVNMALARIFSVETDGDGITFKFDPSKKPSYKVSNIDVLLYDKEGNLLNTVDAYAQFGTVSLDTSKLNEIVDGQLQTSFGQKEKFHYVTIKVSSSDYPSVKYATFLVNVSQLDEANDRFITITISVMVVFWIISVAASVYLAKWSRKPILESYEKQKSFVENASHELRTPLAVLQNRLESLFRKPNSTILDNSESIAASLDEVRNMRLLTTNLLNLARRDDGLNPEIEDIVPNFIDDIFENYNMIAEDSGKTFIGKNQTNRTFKSDKTLLKQLMTILFDNAIKYTGDDGEIIFTVKTTDKQLILQVADNGPGIANEDKKKIFDRFYRVDKARTRQSGGFGLGLSLAQQIVHSLKGTIVVKDNIPKGTIFEVKL